MLHRNGVSTKAPVVAPPTKAVLAHSSEPRDFATSSIICSNRGLASAMAGKPHLEFLFCNARFPGVSESDRVDKRKIGVKVFILTDCVRNAFE